MEQDLSEEGAAKQVTKAPHCEPFTKGQNTVPADVGGEDHVMEIDTALPMGMLDELTLMTKSLTLKGLSGGMMAPTHARNTAVATRARISMVQPSALLSQSAVLMLCCQLLLKRRVCVCVCACVCKCEPCVCVCVGCVREGGEEALAV